MTTNVDNTDNVYRKNQQSIDANGLTEIKIIDNQIMNDNNRADYLDDLVSVLFDLEYYINDFSSTGILYYELCDRYDVHIGENSYSCVMLNDDVSRKNGLEEIVHTDMPEKTETDYTKADKDDRKINRTYLMVDKQNQQISSVVSQVTKQNEKIAKINQTVDDISSQISDIADITTYGESSYAEVTLNDINTSEPIMLKVHPTVTNISYLYPRSNLYPSSNTFMSDRTIRFENIEKYQVTQDILYTEYKQYFSYDLETEEYTLLVAGTDYTVGAVISTTVYEHKYVDYELPDDLLMYSQDVYDEFYLDYNSHTCQVTKRCAYNADGTVSELQSETTTDYEYPIIGLEDGNYKISILGYQYGYVYVRLMAKNVYTDQFYTKSETHTLIDQTASDITLSVDQKLTNYSTTSEMNSAINIKAGEISSVVSTKVGKDEVISRINQSSESVTIDANKLSLNGKTINLTSDNIAINSTNFNVDKNGNVIANSLTSNNATITGGSLRVQDHGVSIYEGVIRAEGGNYLGTLYSNGVTIRPTNSPPDQVSTNCIFMYLYENEPRFEMIGTSVQTLAITNKSFNYISYKGKGFYCDSDGNLSVSGTITQGSLEKNKKNFEKLEDALDIIRNIEIYKYNLKTEEDNIKKHIGFVIGDNFKYSKKVTSNENNGADIYSFVSVCCKAIQEQQQQIEELKKEINKLKEGN